MNADGTPEGGKAAAPTLRPATRPSTGRIAAYRGRHTFHFYLALLSAVVAIVVFGLNLWAYYDEGRLSTQIGFFADFAATGVLFFTWFWGMILPMSGTLPRRRVMYLIVHGMLGSLTPLVYPLAIGLQMDTVNTQPVGAIEVELELLAMLALVAQFISGWSVLNRPVWAHLRKAIDRRRT